MGRNILIFADGTGNEGGLLPDESRTNIYSLFRATIIGPKNSDRSRATGSHSMCPASAPRSRQNRMVAARPKREFSRPMAAASPRKSSTAMSLFSASGAARPHLSFRFQPRRLHRSVSRPRARACPAFRPPRPAASRSNPRAGTNCATWRARRSALSTGGDTRLDRQNRDAAAKEVLRGQQLPRWRRHRRRALYSSACSIRVAALGWAHLSPVTYDQHYPKAVSSRAMRMAIDEYRRDFVRVPWGGSGTVTGGKPGEPEPFQQIGLRGNHSDIGGSYPNDESRLSDITLK